MDGSPSSVLSLGFGSWGSSGLVVTLGFGVGESSPVTIEGIWGDVEHIAADRIITAIKANRTRTATTADRQRIEVKG